MNKKNTTNQTPIPNLDPAKIKELYEAAQEFCRQWPHFLKKIDFNHSNLDARAIRFLNEVPGKIATAIDFNQ